MMIRFETVIKSASGAGLNYQEEAAFKRAILRAVLDVADERNLVPTRAQFLGPKKS
jgi:hypothetical protein